MSITAHWFLPTYGDSRGLVGGGHGVATTAADAVRPAEIGHLAQIARAAETVGFEGALTPTGAWCEDAWLTTAMLVAESERLKFLVAFRPGVLSPTLAAQQAATFQRHSQGRLLLNVVTGGEPAEQRAYGDYLGKDDRYVRTGEFLDVVRRLWAGETVTLHGEQIHVDEAALTRVPDPGPAGLLRGLVAPGGRGRRAARRRLPDLGRATGPGAGEGRVDPGAGRRGGPRGALRHPPARHRPRHLRRRLGAGRALPRRHPRRDDREGAAGAVAERVRGHTEVADRIQEYHDLGITEFVLSGHPHLEEAYWVGEGVLPELGRRGLWSHPAGTTDATPAAIPFAQ
jgi:alkanesulfonate monooxygenase